MFNRIKKFFRRQPVAVYPTNATPQQALVAALRSGVYRQGQGRLRDPQDRFCCLGVACDIYHRETGKGEWVNTIQIDDSADWTFNDGEGAESGARLPEAVGRFFDMDASGYMEPYHGRSLISMNDSGEDFDNIAAAIESGKIKPHKPFVVTA